VIGCEQSEHRWCNEDEKDDGFKYCPYCGKEIVVE
jgi:uncharacterized Zn-finger protein